MADKKPTSGIINDVTENLGVIFRHLLPGLYIVGASYASHPSWFSQFDSQSWQHVVIIAITAVLVGNVAYVLNRYGVHQLIDYLLYHGKKRCCPDGLATDGYLDQLGDHVVDSLSGGGSIELARDHVRTRAASIFLLYTVCELGIASYIWNEEVSFVSRHECQVLALAIFAGLVALWQDAINKVIDHRLVKSELWKNGPPTQET